MRCIRNTTYSIEYTFLRFVTYCLRYWCECVANKKETVMSMDNQGNCCVNESTQQEFQDKGYIIVRSLLNKAELQNLRKTVEEDECFKAHQYGRDDGSGRKTRIVLWNAAGNDITGVIARSEKVAGTMETLLDGEVYHYHSKLILKDAQTGGMHVWHQDYGYWYNNGCLFPNMGTVFIAIDKAHKGNGCLKIIEGSHKMGRLDHEVIGEQNGIGAERIEEILKRFKVTHVELEPGDALFFHCNIIHKSDQNWSNDRRWALLSAYNRADNNPVVKHHHAGYMKLEKASNKEIASCNRRVIADEKDFFRLSKDISVRGLNANSKQ